MIYATAGHTSFATAYPAIIVTVGVTRISTLVFLETSIPISTATIAATYAPAGPAVYVMVLPSEIKMLAPSEYERLPTAAQENITSASALNAYAIATPIAIPEAPWAKVFISVKNPPIALIVSLEI